MHHDLSASDIVMIIDLIIAMQWEINTLGKFAKETIRFVIYNIFFSIIPSIALVY